MAYDSNIREEEVKNKLRADYFKDYDSTPILGNVDFAVAVPTDGAQLFETEYLLWAESKKGTQADICESFVQLILTIGKERTFDKHMPPPYLGAFDAEKIAFIPYDTAYDIFYQNDFNWKVPPSDHTTKEFQQILATIKDTLDKTMVLYHFDSDEKELRRFIRQNFVVGKNRMSKIRISKTNFIHIFQKWTKEVKPHINIDWEIAKKTGIIDVDFYLADILSKDNLTLKEKLYVLLHKDHYVLDRKINDTGLKEHQIAEFQDKGKAHQLFWNRYNRPPKREYWEHIVLNRHLLVPQDIREIKGSYFTPQQWVDLSQQFTFPANEWACDEEFQTDCLVYTLFNNNIQSSFGPNHWIPFTEAEVDAKEKFDSHFMSDYISGKHRPISATTPDLFAQPEAAAPTAEPLTFSPEAQDVMDAGRELWRYYHAQPEANPNASYYDIRLHFQGTKVMKSGKVQMNTESTDQRYTEFVKTLRERLKTLAAKIEPKVYEYGFLKR